jgi:hypothetical protein
VRRLSAVYCFTARGKTHKNCFDACPPPLAPLLSARNSQWTNVAKTALKIGVCHAYSFFRIIDARLVIFAFNLLRTKNRQKLYEIFNFFWNYSTLMI